MVYFDHNATSPLAAEALDAMLPFLRDRYGNPSSAHRAGRLARDAIEQARAQVAGLVHARPDEIVFTSGGTEANNLALKGIAATLSPGEIAISAIEHASVREPARMLARSGWDLIEVAVDYEGRIDPDALEASITPRTRLVSLIHANNETGVVQDVAALAQRARERGVIAHSDAVQAAGRIAVDFAGSGLHLMTLSAHKINGPKGVGALVVDRRVDLEAQLHGGGHEGGRRSGTQNVAGIVGFGVAAARAAADLAERARRLTALRERLETRLAALPGIEIHGAGAHRIPNTTFFSVAGIDGATLLMLLDEDGFALSSGAACGSADPEPSHVLLAMGVDGERARGALRVSLGDGNTAEEIDAFVDTIEYRADSLRRLVRRGAG